MMILESVARTAGSQQKSPAETLALLRLSRPEAPRGPVEQPAKPPASDTTKAEQTLEPRAVERPRQTVSVAVDLIPGSSRLVTSVFDPTTEKLLFRIPTWWSDVEGALGGGGGTEDRRL